MLPTTDPMYLHFEKGSDEVQKLALQKMHSSFRSVMREHFVETWPSSTHQTDGPLDVSSCSDYYCWIVLKDEFSIWNRFECSHRATIPITLPLPTTALPFSAKCVIVYDSIQQDTNNRPVPGVLIVSPEGVLRHWTTIDCQNYTEKVLNIKSEIVLKLELIDPPVNGESATFLLTTNSGTIYYLNGEGANSGKTGELACKRLRGRETTREGTGGSKDSRESLVTNSWTYETKIGNLMLITVSSERLSVYNLGNPEKMWSIQSKEFFQPKIAGFFEQDLKKIPNSVQAKLLDVAVYQDGLMCLLSGCHEDATTVSMFVVWLAPEWETKKPENVKWSWRIPHDEYCNFLIEFNESVANYPRLMIPKITAENELMEQTDGILVVHSSFAISLEIDLKRPVYRIVAFPADQLIGVRLCEYHAYLLFLNNGIFTINLTSPSLAKYCGPQNDQEVVASPVAVSEDGLFEDSFSDQDLELALDRPSSFDFYKDLYEEIANQELNEMDREHDKEQFNAYGQFKKKTSPYATIVDNKEFNAPLFAEKIDRALRAGDKDAVVQVLTSISNAQRQELRGPYQVKYGKDIITALDKKFSGDLEKTIFALMETPLEYDVKQLKAAMKGLETDEAVLIEILCSRTVDQLRAIRVTYEKDYSKALEADIAGDTSGEFCDLLVSLVTGSKDGSHDTNDVQAKDDASRLFAYGKAKLAKKDGSHFLHILATQNQYQLRKVFAYFNKFSGASIEKAIEKEFSGDLQKSYLTIVRAASDKQKFFAQQLYTSMKGLGTRDNDLIRVLVTRSEVDLELIKTEFAELYQKSLADMVKGDTSGAYRDALLAIINGNHAIAH